MLNLIQDAIKLIIPAKHKTSSSGWISFNAVCCQHNGETADARSRGGLVLNPDGGTSYHCFNCGFKASYVPGRHLTYRFRKLLAWLGADDNTIKRLVIDAIRIKELVGPTEVVEAESAPVAFRPRPLPEDTISFSEWRTFLTLSDDHSVIPDNLANAVKYVHDRNGDMITRYEFYVTDTTAYNLNRRVIIPFTWHNEIIGYTARAVDDTVKPKYHSSYEPNYVFNVDRQRPESKFVIVCEGPFDAMSIDGVAVLSNRCSEQQADIIDSLGREVVVVPDADRAGADLINDAIEYGWSVSFPVWQEKHKDIASAVAEYGRLFVLKSILAGKESNALKIELMKKKLYNKL